MSYKLSKGMMAIAVVSISFMLGGCASKATITSDSYTVSHELIASSAEKYQLQVGDKISIVCVVNEQLDAVDPYFINTGDVINVKVLDRSDLSYQYKVNPDGTVQFIQLDSLQIAGLTLNELRPKLKAMYGNLGVNDAITVGFSVYNAAVDSFIEKLSPGGIGLSPFATTIAVDGNANFPLVGFVKLNDLTLQEANDLISKKYRDHFKSIDVTLRIEESSGHNIIVLGEVLKPGTFGVNGTLSVLSALGAAGGYTNQAKLDSIMTVQRRGEKVFVNKFDLETDMFAMASVKLIAGDFVFVPKSTIANVNTFVDQYLRRVTPFNLNLSGSYLVNDL
jgi:protein involved in polysaccharide export with SLBB domain